MQLSPCTWQGTMEANVLPQQMSMEPVSRSFYSKGTVTVARNLLGKYLVRMRGGDSLIGRIVEVEAYRGSDDPASHAYRGKTPRNMPMFGEPGHAYIYFTYGNHFCLNVTTRRSGTAGAVLIRAVEPCVGIELMRKLRPGVPDQQLTNGPGKLTKSFDISKSLNETDMTARGPLFIGHEGKEVPFVIGRSPRIGIRVGTERLWRFYVKFNPYVTKR
jgi:DNA-3-methyladenine glycosylase